MKKFVLLTVLLMLLISCAAVFADQDGKSCWCNVDQYGCWNTGDDGGKSYIMFWSEEARQYIMGTGSAPYKLVVEKPGSSDTLKMKCGVPAPVVIPTPAPATKPTPVPDPNTKPSDDKDNKNPNKPVEPVKTVDPLFEACIKEYGNCYRECTKDAKNSYELNMCGVMCTQQYNCYYIK
ncbi:MAG: hypothetical protein IJI07_02140 [Flexilinea sp.]|nr:hypothetical protein [Flexilinea sp.]